MAEGQRVPRRTAQIQRRPVGAAVAARPAQPVGHRHLVVGGRGHRRPVGDDVAAGEAALLQHRVERPVQRLGDADGTVEPLRLLAAFRLRRHGNNSPPALASSPALGSSAPIMSNAAPRRHPLAPIDAAAVLAWYDRHARPLPWRVSPADRAAGIRPDPYRVWLSEIMLQQTTVAAVAKYYARFT